MRIVVHDYAGYSFPIQLSRELAGRGHDVFHLYCADVVGARGAVDRRPDDPSGFAIEGLSIGHPFVKYSMARRFADETSYGRIAAARVRAYAPRAVLSANTPLLSQKRLQAESHRSRRRFVYWWQDSYGVGVREVVARRSPGLAPLAGRPFEALEQRMLRTSDRVVAISDGMRQTAEAWGVDPGRIDVIPNWAHLGEILPGPGDNAWKHEAGLSGAPLVLYAGTLGLKHDPDLLLSLAGKFQAEGARLAVVSQGPGREWLENRKRGLGLHNLVLLDYQPQDRMSEVLASADVVVALLQPDAAAFSVPSKVFSYLCAGRPVVASIPPDNQAAEVLRSSGAGVCVSPGDTGAFVDAVTGLLAAPERRRRMGAAGRAYAEAQFAVGPIADRFERVLAGPRGTGRRISALRIAGQSVTRIVTHPENRGRRAKAVATYGAWQVWQRTARRPWTVELTDDRRIRCRPHSPATAAVLYCGLPDPLEMRFLLRYLRAGDTFVDVGAHEGVYTLLASSVQGVRVLAVEPSSESFSRLAENLRLNGIDGALSAVRVALGDRDGEVWLSTGAGPMNAVVESGGAPSERVPVTTLDHLVATHEASSVAAVKLDVEGLELDVLAGALATIERNRPALVVEVNDPERLATFAAAHGYVCVRYAPESGQLSLASVASFEGGNAIFVPDFDEAFRRLQR